MGAELSAALVQFQSQMPTVNKGKTAKVPTKSGGEYSYSYADLADVVKECTPTLVACGLAFTARPRRTDQGDYELAGVLTHTSGEEVEGSLPIFGRTAQEIGSSLTYGRRYLFGCMTGIVTDVDDDGAHAPSERTRRAPSAAELQAERMNAARALVRGAWEQTHAGAWDPNAMIADFEQLTAMPIVDAAEADLTAYAKHLQETP